MRVLFTKAFKDAEEIELTSLVHSKLEDSNERGELETIERRLNNITEYIADLTNILADKGIFTFDELSTLLGTIDIEEVKDHNPVLNPKNFRDN